jgi:plastocyanin
MNRDFRERAFLPVIMPVAVILGFFAFAFSLSRVFLALPQMVSTLTALAVAGYVLLIAGLVSARHRISSTALGVGLVLGMAGVVAAGAVSAAVGPREFHDVMAEHAEEPVDDGAPDDVAVDVPEGAIVFTAIDIDFVEDRQEAPAGDVTFVLVNEGNILHDLTIDELGIHMVANPGETVVEDVTLQPGTYDYYCSVPGHRAAGMEGTLQVQ